MDSEFVEATYAGIERCEGPIEDAELVEDCAADPCTGVSGASAPNASGLAGRGSRVGRTASPDSFEPLWSQINIPFWCPLGPACELCRKGHAEDRAALRRYENKTSDADLTLKRKLRAQQEPAYGELPEDRPQFWATRNLMQTNRTLGHDDLVLDYNDAPKKLDPISLAFPHGGYHILTPGVTGNPVGRRPKPKQLKRPVGAPRKPDGEVTPKALYMRKYRARRRAVTNYAEIPQDRENPPVILPPRFASSRAAAAAAHPSARRAYTSEQEPTPTRLRQTRLRRLPFKHTLA
jgi:hypothetical protein